MNFFGVEIINMMYFVGPKSLKMLERIPQLLDITVKKY